MKSELGNKSVMAKNIAYYLELHNMKRKELCEKLGFNYSTLADWLHARKYPRIDKIEKMANLFNISKADLVEPRQTRHLNPPAEPRVMIPVFANVAAGIPTLADNDIVDYEDISSVLARHGEYFGIIVHGRSMEPTICDGDIVIVRKQEDVDNGDIAIVMINGNEATCKEIKEAPEGVTLIGHNVAVYSPQFYSNKEIEELPVRIIGKAIEVRHKL